MKWPPWAPKPKPKQNEYSVNVISHTESSHTELPDKLVMGLIISNKRLKHTDHALHN